MALLSVAIRPRIDNCRTIVDENNLFFSLSLFTSCRVLSLFLLCNVSVSDYPSVLGLWP